MVESTNIRELKGIGEKTAISLLVKYGSLDGLYENIESVTGKTKEKLLADKDNAYMSYEIATIYRDVPLEINISDIKYLGNTPKIAEIYEELEFYSLLKNLKTENLEEKKQEKLNFKEVKSLEEININDDCAIYLELDNDNYHQSHIIGMGIYNKDNALYISSELLKQNPNFFNNINYFN